MSTNGHAGNGHVEDGAVATLTKETSLLILPGLVLQLRHGVDRRTRAFCFTAFGCAKPGCGNATVPSDNASASPANLAPI